MRVLHITETMASGVLKYIQEVVNVKGSETDEHYIVYSKRTYTPIDLQKLFPDGVHLINVDIKMKRGFFESIKTLYLQIRKINPDVIHLHSSIAGFIGRMITLCFPNIKVFYTPHGYSFLMTNKHKLTRVIYWLVEFMMSQFIGNIIACSKSEYKFAKKLSLFRKVFLLENCINVLNFQKETTSSLYKQVIGVGRMEEQKDPRLFIEIAALLRQMDSSVKAVWIGDGSLKTECEELNRSLNAEVIFTGWLSNEETLEYLQRSTVFLQTSKWEGLPYSVLEAFAVGLPVVASDINSHRDLIGNSYLGFIAKDKKQYIDYTVALLNDGGLSNIVSETNKRKLEQNYITFSQELHSIYSENFG